MSREITKYKLSPELGIAGIDHGHTKVISLPITSIPRHVAQQHNHMVVWIEQTNHPVLRDFTFVCIGTGAGDVPAGFRYLGSVQCTDGYVWHVYYKVGSIFEAANA